MAHNIFIGIDGGGSKSKVRVEDNDGHVLGEVMSGPANIRLSVEGAWHSIHTALTEIFSSHSISLEDKNYHFHAGLGLAGCEVKEAVQAFLKQSHFFRTIELNTDAHIACIGAHKDADGVIIIAGTGVVGYQMEAGRGTRVGGWGFPCDDEGGGAWLGLEATRLTFQWLDQRVEKSPLVEEVFAYFNQDLTQLVSWTNSAKSNEFARLAPIVIHHSQQAEGLAVGLMKRAAEAIDKIAQALIKMRKQENTLPCCLLGGVAPFIAPWLSEELRSTLIAPQDDATTGAILMIRERVKKDKL